MDNLANKNENKKTNKNELTVTDATAQIFDWGLVDNFANWNIKKTNTKQSCLFVAIIVLGHHQSRIPLRTFLIKLWWITLPMDI